MDRQISKTRVSIAERIRRMPMSAADRDMALDCFVAAERSVDRLAKTIGALRRLLFSGTPSSRHAQSFTRMSSSRMAAR